jgi:hypothetical protein
MHGLEGLQSIAYDFYLQGNDNLENLIGLDNLASIGRTLNISYNPGLLTLTGLESLIHLDSALNIYHNLNLISLEGIENLDLSSLQDLEVYDNDSLSECDVESICNYLANPTGKVVFYENKEGCNNPSQVADSCGFSIPCLPYGNYYLLSQNDIDHFQDLYPDCSFLGGKTYIHGADVTNLLGLSDVQGFGRQLMLYDNPTLTSLEGLEEVTFIGAGITIMYNDILTSLSGLGHFNTDTMVVMTISDNHSLTSCAIESVCDFIVNHGPYADISIYNNAPGCIDQTEVEADCFDAVPDNRSQKTEVSVYPNPGSGTIQFSVLSPHYSRVTIKIYDIHGREVATVLDSDLAPGNLIISWETGSLAPGVYFHRTSTIDNRQSTMGKIIVVK